ncbi:MAG: isoprenylcysteine carboxylmethyltransferase family protein [Mariprofundaceae bacterium]
MSLMDGVKKTVDAFIYLFIGPFTVIGTVPLLLLDLDSHMGLSHYTSEITNAMGYLLINMGAALALWCSWLMRDRGGSPIPSQPAKGLVKSGPYTFVRHPMMYSLLLVGIGEVFVTGSLLILIWLPIAMRAGAMFITVYEEPVLLARYGDIYKDYCEEVPRWLPKRGAA